MRGGARSSTSLPRASPASRSHFKGSGCVVLMLMLGKKDTPWHVFWFLKDAIPGNSRYFKHLISAALLSPRVSKWNDLCEGFSLSLYSANDGFQLSCMNYFICSAFLLVLVLLWWVSLPLS